VGQLIRKDPSERPADAAEVERRALALARPNGRVVPPAAASTSASDPTLTAVLRRPALRLGPAALRLRRAAARSRRVYVAAAVLVAAVAGSFFVAARPAVTRVPDLRGHSVAAAVRTLDDKGIDAEKRVVDDPDGQRGTVLRQKPAPGTTADDDTVVVLVVASGKTNLAADDVLGETYQAAARRLVELGLVPARAIGENPGGAVVGSVIAVEPAGRLPLGSTVTLTLAAAPGVDASPTVGQGSSGHVKPPPRKHSHKSPKPPKPHKPHGHGKGHKRH
jgi:serine/threonine-protein kinase